MNRVSEKGKVWIGKMDVIFMDLILGTRIDGLIMMNVIVSRLEYAEGVWGGNAKLVNKLETVWMTVAQECCDA